MIYFLTIDINSYKHTAEYNYYQRNNLNLIAIRCYPLLRYSLTGITNLAGAVYDYHQALGSDGQ